MTYPPTNEWEFFFWLFVLISSITFICFLYVGIPRVYIAKFRQYDRVTTGTKWWGVKITKFGSLCPDCRAVAIIRMGKFESIIPLRTENQWEERNMEERKKSIGPFNLDSGLPKILPILEETRTGIKTLHENESQQQVLMPGKYKIKIIVIHRTWIPAKSTKTITITESNEIKTNLFS